MDMDMTKKLQDMVKALVDTTIARVNPELPDSYKWARATGMLEAMVVEAVTASQDEAVARKMLSRYQERLAEKIA